MPTGYTCDVKDGKVTTLRQFALQCSRAFGALIMMREDPMDAPIPEKLFPDTKYYDERIAEAKKELSELPQMNAFACEERAKTQFDEAMASHHKYAVERALSKQRYEEMLNRTEQWQVPEDIAALKSFMLEQLRESIRFDCSDNYRPEPPVRLTGEKWRELQLANASRSLAYNSLEREKEIQRTEGRNSWLLSLWRSLPPAEKPAKAA